MQARYARLFADSRVSFNRGVAARVGTSIIAFGDDTTSRRHGPQVAALDGRPLPLVPGGRTDLPGGAVLTFTQAAGRWCAGPTAPSWRPAAGWVTTRF